MYPLVDPVAWLQLCPRGPFQSRRGAEPRPGAPRQRVLRRGDAAHAAPGRAGPDRPEPAGGPGRGVRQPPCHRTEEGGA